MLSPILMISWFIPGGGSAFSLRALFCTLSGVSDWVNVYQNIVIDGLKKKK